MADGIQEKRDRVARAIETYADTVRRICFLYLKSSHDVEDIFQEVFLQLLKHEEAFTGPAHERAWLIKVAVNKCKDLHKSFFRSRVISLDELDLAYEDEAQSDLIRELLALPQKYRDVLYLHYYEGYTAPEISKIIGCRENTVYSWLHRARQALKERLEG